MAKCKCMELEKSIKCEPGKCRHFALLLSHDRKMYYSFLSCLMNKDRFKYWVDEDDNLCYTGELDINPDARAIRCWDCVQERMHKAFEESWGLR